MTLIAGSREVRLEIGGGIWSTDFVPLAEGADMTMILGPSGLAMLTPSLCANNVWPGQAGRKGRNIEDPSVSVEIYQPADSALIGGSDPNARYGLTPTEDCLQLMQIYVPFDRSWAELEALFDQPLRLEATVTDACQRTAHDDLNVVFRRD